MIFTDGLHWVLNMETQPLVFRISHRTLQALYLEKVTFKETSKHANAYWER